jgi:hypothetical protein
MKNDANDRDENNFCVYLYSLLAKTSNEILIQLKNTQSFLTSRCGRFKIKSKTSVLWDGMTISKQHN